jgi:hypothetical protein
LFWKKVFPEVAFYHFGANTEGALRTAGSGEEIAK